MAINVTLLTAGSGLTTASVTFTSGRLYLASAFAYSFSATVGTTTITNFDNLGTAGGEPFNGNLCRIQVLRHRPGSDSTSARTFTNTNTGVTFRHAILEVTGEDTSGTNGDGAIVQVVDQNTTGDSPNTWAMTLAALTDATNNAVVAVFGAASVGTQTPSSGYNELTDVGGLAVNWLLPGTTTPGTTDTLAFGDIGGIGIEIKAAAAGGAIDGISSLALSTAGAVTGAGALAGQSSPAFSTTGAITGAGVLSGTSAAVFSPAATLVGSGALLGTSAPVFALTGAVTGNGVLAGASALAFSLAGILENFSAGAITGMAALTFSASGAAAGAGALAGSSSVVFASTPIIWGIADIAGSAPVAFSTTAALVGSGALAGASAIAISVDGLVVGYAAVAGQSAMTFSVQLSTARLDPFGQHMVAVPFRNRNVVAAERRRVITVH